MRNRIGAAHTPGSRRPDWLIAVFIMLMIVVANGGLMAGLLQIVSWTECAMLVVAGALLSGGVLFTVVTMQRLSAEE